MGQRGLLRMATIGADGFARRADRDSRFPRSFPLGVQRFYAPQAGAVGRGDAESVVAPGDSHASGQWAAFAVPSMKEGSHVEDQ